MLCVNTCHVLREHEKFDEFAGPRFFVRLAGLEMHPLDIENRIPEIVTEYYDPIAIIGKKLGLR
jgi:succinate dehydrogenase / fumarate reductase iron-sulfur subunit